MRHGRQQATPTPRAAGQAPRRRVARRRRRATPPPGRRRSHGTRGFTAGEERRGLLIGARSKPSASGRRAGRRIPVALDQERAGRLDRLTAPSTADPFKGLRTLASNWSASSSLPARWTRSASSRATTLTSDSPSKPSTAADMRSMLCPIWPMEASTSCGAPRACSIRCRHRAADAVSCWRWLRRAAFPDLPGRTSGRCGNSTTGVSAADSPGYNIRSTIVHDQTPAAAILRDHGSSRGANSRHRPSRFRSPRLAGHNHGVGRVEKVEVRVAPSVTRRRAPPLAQHPAVRPTAAPPATRAAEDQVVQDRTSWTLR